MKKERTKGIISGILVSALVFSLIGTAAATVGQRTLIADYNDIKISVNGTPITPTDAKGNSVEPFAVNGTTYLPVRAIGNALGLDVDWDSNTNTAILAYSDSGFTALNSIQLLGLYKILEENLTDLQESFDGVVTGMLERTANTKLSDGPYKGMTICEAGIAKINDQLVIAEEHYIYCSNFLLDSDTELMLEYRRLAGVAKNAYQVFGDNPSSLAISNLTGAATQNYYDCMLASMKANAAFWETYQYAFQ